MGKKCCVSSCGSNNHRSRAKNETLKSKNDTKNADRFNIPTFGFPKEENEKQRWISAIPYLTTEIFDAYKFPPCVCVKHWPTGYEEIKSVNGKLRPRNPPSIFTSVPPSAVPTPPPKPRPTKLSSSSTRSIKPDELPEFTVADKLSYESLCNEIHEHVFVNASVVTYQIDNTLWIQSSEFISGVPKYSIKVFRDLTYESYHTGVQCKINKTVGKRVNSWSKLDEAMRYLRCMDPSRHEIVLQEQIASMKPQQVGKKMYSPEVVVRAFSYFATSRCTYEKLRADYKLPSVRTMTNITSKVNNIDDQRFINEVFRNLPRRQKKCIILVDEVYVRRGLLYHGGRCLGRAKNCPELANAVLGIMLKCSFGGPTFLLKMVPVKGMTAEFLYKQVKTTMDLVHNASGETFCIISDGNRTNQKFWKMFSTVPNKPWLTKNGVFLLYDYVHLLKCIRNNWLTEQNSEIKFKHKGKQFTAKWENLIQLFELERKAAAGHSGVYGLSKLNEVSVRPKPIERQSVPICQRVFCEETLTALRVHPGLNQKDCEGTILFIEKVLSVWKIVNVRSKYKDIRKNDPLVGEIESTDDDRLTFLLEMGDFFKSIGKSSTGKRKNSLTKDTSDALFHTMNGLVELCRHQLETTHEYVLLGDYSTDPLEKEFGKLRQGSGGAYFLTVQTIMEKLSIKKTKLLLKLNADVDNINVDNGHQCDQCGYLLDDNTIKVFDELAALEEKIEKETKISLCHIAGYVTRHDILSDDELFSCTNFYFQKYGTYTKSLDRGGLNVPTDKACQWTFLCYIMFNSVKDLVCRKSLANIMMMISDAHGFEMKRSHGNTLCNIFFKNYCVEVTPRSTKEPKKKALKFSS